MGAEALEAIPEAFAPRNCDQLKPTSAPASDDARAQESSEQNSVFSKTILYRSIQN